MNTLRTLMAMILTLVVATAPQVLAVSHTVAGVTFDTDNSVTSAVETDEGSISGAPFYASLGADDEHHIGTLLGSSSGSAVDITGGTNGSGGRVTLTLTWDAGMVVVNQAGDDLYVFESGGSGDPEAYGVAVRETGSSTFTGFRYEFFDDYDTSYQKLVTGFDLTDFGIAEGDHIDAVQIISIHNASATGPTYFEDRVDDSSGEGTLTLDAGSGTGYALLKGPNASSPTDPFEDNKMDADIVYVVATNVGAAPAPPPSVSFSAATYGIITQEEIETMLGITFEGPPGVAMALDSDGSSLIMMTDPSSSLGVVGRLIDLDPVAGTAALVAVETELIAGSQNTGETDQDITGIWVEGDIIYLLDAGGDEHQLLAVDRSGGLPVTASNISVVNTAPITDTGNFDTQLAFINGEFILADPGTGNFISINSTTGAEGVAITSAQVLAGTGGSGSGFNAAGPKNCPGESVFVWNDSDYDGGTGDLFIVDPAVPSFTVLLPASASPGGDPDMSQLAIDSEGVVYTWGTFIGDGVGEALQVIEADGTHHIFPDDDIALVLGIDAGDIGYYGRGIAAIRGTGEVTVYWSTSDSGADVFTATFGTTTAAQGWEVYR